MYFFFVFIFVLFVVVLGMGLRASHMLGKRSTSELHPQPIFIKQIRLPSVLYNLPEAYKPTNKTAF
jgi:hypothetical protein